MAVRTHTAQASIFHLIAVEHASPRSMTVATQTDADSLTRHLSGLFEEALSASVAAFSSHREVLTYALSGGHRSRPMGCLLACSAVGGTVESAIDVAVAVEFIHKSSVIRDDIADDDDQRSGHSAVHTVYGPAIALAVSDVLWSEGLARIAALPTHWRAASVGSTVAALREMAIGQLEDVAPSLGANSVTARLEVDERKTGALSELACRLGAITGDGADDDVKALSAYGRKLGTAFQVLNTIRNIAGLEPDRPAATDLRKRRDTVLTAHSRAMRGPDVRVANALDQLLPDLDDPAVTQLRATLLSDGAVTFGKTLAASLLSDARRLLESLPPTPARCALTYLAGDGLLSIYDFDQLDEVQ